MTGKARDADAVMEGKFVCSGDLVEREGKTLTSRVQGCNGSRFFGWEDKEKVCK